MLKSKSDHSVFYKRSTAGIIMLVVYVDDIVITGNDTREILSLKSFLHTQFHMRIWGCSSISWELRSLEVNKTGKLGVKPCSTAMSPNVHLTRDGEPFEDPEKYRGLVGKLNYLTVTHPDIAFSVSIVSQFISSPTVHHWVALEQILCYLKGAQGRGVVYVDHRHTHIEYFSDVDWVGSKLDRRSTSCYCIFVGGNLVSRKSKKQNVVSRSSAEPEYGAMPQCVCEIKHIKIDCHFVREKIQQGLISRGYVKTGEQLRDIFTKALNGMKIM
ncbi:uncharacterized mitochondrial protein AtMg00810-like [Humulus lupulus]|uniref:uncharacterized mitochondrial protein AtMg00810-like n=1 Tax=Humulus lupulus TaxID=3486 RepID=UPI002B40BC5C|nr:uncharacterized mitochondrial protein AtMg00810-like [Humulus lupulus]